MRTLVMILISALSLFFFVFVSGTASAATISISGTFGGTVGEGIGPISGSFSLSFDDSVLTGSHDDFFDLQPLTTFSLSPNPIGSTSFDLANTSAFLRYEFGVLVKVIVGGSITGTATISSLTDDFSVVYNSPLGGGPPSSIYASTTTNGIPSTGATTGSISVVPEPSTALLMGLGLAGLASRRR